MSVITLVVIAIWVMLPAYLPNNIAVLAGGGSPIDGGREWRGRRVLGDGKTWRGTIVGSLVGIGVAIGLNTIHPSISHSLGLSVPLFSLMAIVSLPVGAMLGDIAASFVKRRTGRERGASFPVIDQLDFVFGALLLTVILDPGWFFETFDWVLVLIIIVITPILHIVTNIIGYLLGFKQEPY